MGRRGARARPQQQQQQQQQQKQRKQAGKHAPKVAKRTKDRSKDRPKGRSKVAKRSKDRSKIRVGTWCSGLESIGLAMIALRLTVEHVFSSDLLPSAQAAHQSTHKNMH